MPLAQGMQYCLTIIDRFTRWPTAIPLPNITAATIAKALYTNWIVNFGTPLSLGTQLVHTTSYHPQSNGIIERIHLTLKAALRYCTQSWLDALPMVLLGLRTSFTEDLQASPAEMLFSTTLRIPGEFFTTATAQTNSSAFVNSLYQVFQSIRPFPASRHATQHPFWKPLEPPYMGPHRVISRNDDRTYVINVDGEEKTVSTDQLKPAYAS
ncbi:uncharacterized protein LOC106644199 [Copidosoma floridanum]|uniref:uncharacterized protein LOC106644199 n=1 Tax=Copidosoma floridanum TaxID=29053 RepID=UPI0006C9651F|nr:uncharacterized protein LOC106644199 [Copidosoma floridanum]